MRVTSAGGKWLVNVWLNRQDLEQLSGRDPLDVSTPGGVRVSLQPTSESRVRAARIDEDAAKILLPHSVIEAMHDGRIRDVKAFNGALPLSVTVLVEPGIGIPEWLTGATEDW